MELVYVDDSPADLKLVSHLFAEDPNVKLHTLSSLQDALTSSKGQMANPDCILLDVIRPDSSSIEDDLQAVRSKTNAPVFMVSNFTPDDLRQRAVKNGADGLLEKSALSRELILQVVANAISRRTELANTQSRTVANDDNNSIDFYRLDSSHVSTQTLAPVGQSLKTHLNRIQELTAKGVNIFGLCHELKHVSDLADAMHALLQQDVAAAELLEIRKLCAGLQGQIETFGLENGVAVMWDLERAPYFQIGSSLSGFEGLKHVFKGLIGMMKRGTTLLITGFQTDPAPGLTINCYATGLNIPHNWLDFSYQQGHGPIPINALSSLNLGFSLLGLSKEQITVQKMADTAVVSINL